MTSSHPCTVIIYFHSELLRIFNFHESIFEVYEVTMLLRLAVFHKNLSCSSEILFKSDIYQKLTELIHAPVKLNDKEFLLTFTNEKCICILPAL